MAVLASAVWRVRAGGNNANGGGYDAGIAGAATDYSQQDTAQATGTLGTAAGTTAFSDAGGVFTSVMVGNALFIASGAGFTVGVYYITGYTSTTAITIDRSPGTGSAAVWKIGGAWADPWTNLTSALSYIAPGNIVYVRGAGSDNPGSADYTKGGGGFIVPKAGDGAAGYIKIIGENGRPRLTSDGLMYYQCSAVSLENLFLSTSGVSNATLGIINGLDGGLGAYFVNCAVDQNGKDMLGIAATGVVVGCEVFSSSANGGAAGANAGIKSFSYGAVIENCNVHNTWGPGIQSGAVMPQIIFSVIAKCTGNGIELSGSTTAFRGRITHCTIDGNLGHGVNVATAAALLEFDCYSNLITNHAVAAKYAINVAAGTTAVNDRIKSFWDFNWLYGNTGTYNTISAGVHDTAGTDPLYTDQTTQDYTLQATSPVIAKGFPAGATYAVPGATPAPTSTLSPLVPRRKVSPDVTNYMDMGGIQRIMATGGGMLVNPGMTGRKN